MENRTIEDEIFDEIAGVLTKKDYIPGTNEDLTIACRICGENTKRGKYYVRVIEEPRMSTPYLFICPECYNSLQEGENYEEHN